ncbi:hypothetical protein MLD52_18680 [Puniceicoccaceae bacterium K14]|nr:hypothetical protein [Puniceicoccaceae bacterium K14]
MKDLKSGSSKIIYTVWGGLLSNCTDALRLVELGQKRPLKARERLRLWYNSPLCLHCNCQRGKFKRESAKLRAIEAERAAGKE